MRRLKVLGRAAIGKELLVTPDINCMKRRFGSDYGGWDVVATNIHVGSIVYSFGVGDLNIF